MMLTQLNPPLPLLTPKGKAWAHLVIDYGPEADLMWICFQDQDGACWTWSNRDVRIQANATLGRVIPPP
jgi:hypothetical protein